jgi:hypothetical protein
VGAHTDNRFDGGCAELNSGLGAEVKVKTVVALVEKVPDESAP